MRATTRCGNKTGDGKDEGGRRREIESGEAVSVARVDARADVHGGRSDPSCVRLRVGGSARVGAEEIDVRGSSEQDVQTRASEVHG